MGDDCHESSLLSGDGESVVAGLKGWGVNEMRLDLEAESPLFCRAAQAGMNNVCIAYLAHMVTHGLGSSLTNMCFNEAMAAPASSGGIATLASLKESRLLQHLRAWQREFLSGLCKNPSGDEGKMRRAAALAVRLPADSLMEETEEGVSLGCKIFLQFRIHIAVSQLPDEVFGPCRPVPLLWHVVEHGPRDLVQEVWEEMKRRGTIEAVAFATNKGGSFCAVAQRCTDEDTASWEWLAPRLVEHIGEELFTRETKWGCTIMQGAALRGNFPLVRALGEKFGKAAYLHLSRLGRTVLDSAFLATRPALEVIHFLVEECPELADSVDYRYASRYPEGLLEILQRTSRESWHWLVGRGTHSTLAHFLAEDSRRMEVRTESTVGAIEVLQWLCARCEPSWLRAQDTRGRTALHLTFLFGNFEKASVIAGAMDREGLLLCDKDGSTPAHLLMLSHETRGQTIGQFMGLLPKEVLRMRNKKGDTVSELAAAVGKHECAAQLQPMVKGAQ